MSDHLCECGGTGVHQWTKRGAPIERAGLEVQSTTSGTSLCDCRKALPPRDGKAHWWTRESVYHADVDTCLLDVIAVTVDAEVPVSQENYIVHRYGNRYYPTMVDMTIGGERAMLHVEIARELAAKILEAANAAEAIDKPDTDICGHWAPCECVKVRA